MLQSEKVLTQLKGMDGHAIWNVFKRWQNVINGISISRILHIYSSYGMWICRWIVIYFMLLGLGFTLDGKA
jgi:hypothetical protein